MTSAIEIINTANAWLKPHIFRDYCPNGLQIEGDARQIKTIACAVTASQYVIEQAINNRADMLIVHHGFFWKGEPQTITGSKKKRISRLLESGLHLLAYHLPLDAHPTMGNNAKLADKLGLDFTAYVPDKPDSILCTGFLQKSTTGHTFCQLIEDRLARKPLFIGDPKRKLKTFAWCTGGAQSYFPQAIEQGVDAFITGEISEQNYHQSQESGVCYIAAGHHATERYGVQSLTEKLSAKYSLEYFFIDEKNPV